MPVIGPYFPRWGENFSNFMTNFPMSHFVLHFGENHENRLKNNEVTADYIEVCGRF